MKVQQVRLPSTNRVTWLVLDDDFVPVQPILAYLQFLDDLDRSPHTVRATASHLKLFWEYQRDEGFSWTAIDLALLAGFITWLRRPDPTVISVEYTSVRRTNATIDQILGSVHSFYEFHVRLKTVPELSLYHWSMPYRRRYKPFLYGIVKTRPVRTRIVSTKREQRRPKTLTSEQVQTLIAACTHTRDTFLLTLLFQTGMRIGHYVG
jgi:integrase/recombinase XerD